MGSAFRRIRGVSLLEVVVALAVLGVALGGLAPVLVRCTTLLIDARAETTALAIAVSRMEQLRALVYEQNASTLAAVTDDVTNLADEPPTPRGTGIRPGNPDAVWSDIPGFVDAVPEAGAPARGAGQWVFIRRWAVSALPASGPTEPLLIQVMARDAARERREPARTSGALRPGDVWLFTIRTRVLR